MSNIDAVASDLFATISAFIDKRIAEAVASIEVRLATMPPPKDGEPGAAGKDAEVDYARIAGMFKEMVLTPKDGEPGVDGKDAEPEAVVPIVLEQLKAPVADMERRVEKRIDDLVFQAMKSITPGKDGDPGRDGKDADPAAIVPVVLEQLEAPVADMELRLVHLIEGNIAAAIKTIPAGKDGDPGRDGKDGASVELEAVVKAAVALIPVPKDGAPGEDGRDGRDAIQIEVLDVIDPERRYQRGTYAKHRGGRIRAFRATDPMGDGPLEKFGWTDDFEGIAEVGVEQGEDLRSFAIGVVLTSGKAACVTKFTLPVVLDRGKYEREKSYERGDSVSWDGSTWIAQTDIGSAGDKPLPPDWRLSNKRGQDGKDLRPEEAPRVREPLRLR